MAEKEHIRSAILRTTVTFWNGHDDRKMSIIGLITIGALLVDYGVSTFFGNIGAALNSSFGVALFGLIIVILYGFCSQYLLAFCKSISANLRFSYGFSKFNTMTKVIQYCLLILLLAIVVQMALSNQYYTGFYIAAIAIGTLPAVLMLAFLGYKLLSWYKIDKQNMMILLLGLSASIGAVALLANVDILDVIWSNKPAIIQPQTAVDFGDTFPPHIRIPYNTFITVAMLSALLEWAGIAMLLRHFSKKIGRIKYWAIACLPAAGLISGMLPIMFTSQSNYSQFTSEMTLFRIVTVFGASSLYVMWAVGYLTVSRKLRQINQSSTVARYMTLSAIGIILLGYSYATPAFFATYPPYGVASHSFLALGVYLFAFGFYASAVSVSQDAKLRRSIKKDAFEQLRLVRSIGNAKVEEDMRNKVLATAKANLDEMKSQTGIDTSISEEEAKEYVDQVIKELQKKSVDLSSGSVSSDSTV